MPATALLFGSIGTILETSEMQRTAFNRAFQSVGLNWNWDESFYRSQLGRSGGRRRIESYAKLNGETVDSAEVHRLKTVHFGEALATGDHEPRPGVIQILKHAREQGMKTGFVTSTSQENVDAVFKALGNTLTRNDFDFVGTSDKVANSKPHPDIYLKALEELGVDAGNAVAIEDSKPSLTAANAAEIACIAFPSANTGDQDFRSAAMVTEILHPDQIDSILKASRASISEDFAV